MKQKALTITPPPGGFDRERLLQLIESVGLTQRVRGISGGPFGHSPAGLMALESLLHAADLAFGAGRALAGLIRSELSGGADFVIPQLSDEHQQLVAGFQVVVLSDAVRREFEAICGVVEVDGELERDGLDSLLSGDDQLLRLKRVLKLSERYLAIKAAEGGKPVETRAARMLVAFMTLLQRAVTGFLIDSPLRPLVEALEHRQIDVAGQRYRGLTALTTADNPSGLLPIRPEQIVGNVEYLRAGLRLARDVAGYDFEAKNNPKRINPVLFGLGRPGCGKTVTAHAVGNFFLEYCRERGIAARFRVVQRTDWASSYQNASAANLVKIFKEEVYDFDGVCGVYWPDIDTAFASRSSNSLRIEEKQNLGAVFGIFDGTLLPKDGKWFLICDANTMHMDEATVSRIAQNPFTVEGPTTAEHYVALMRDILLKKQRDFLPESEDAWQRIGELGARLALSGRAIDAICGNVRAQIQDFEFPASYFVADSAGREAMLKTLCNRVSEQEICTELNRYVEFQRDAEERDDEARFESDVDQMVRQLNASRIAAQRVVGLEDVPNDE